MLKNTGIYKIILLQKPMLWGAYRFSFFIITWICSIKRRILLNLAVDSRVNTENVFLAFVLIQEWVKRIYIYRKEGSLHWLRFLTALHCSWSSSSWRFWGLSKFSVNFHFFSNGIKFYSCNGDGPIYCPLLKNNNTHLIQFYVIFLNKMLLTFLVWRLFSKRLTLHLLDL